VYKYTTTPKNDPYREKVITSFLNGFRLRQSAVSTDIVSTTDCSKQEPSDVAIKLEPDALNVNSETELAWGTEVDYDPIPG